MDKRSQMACLKECGRLLGLGCSVLFFPEGTRTTDGKMAAFKKVIPFCLGTLKCLLHALGKPVLMTKWSAAQS